MKMKGLHLKTGQSRTNFGFTLIELLVVIAIIAILASILFPVFARARENARRSSCSSNLKQIGLGVLQYTQDYDERFPIYYSTGAAPNVGWADTLQPYLKSLQIYQCPSESRQAPTSDATQPGYSDYSINGMLCSTVAGSIVVSHSQAELTQPSLTVMNMDDYSYNGTMAEWGCLGVLNGCISITTTTPDFAKFINLPNGEAIRHLGGQNFSFTDGHVKWYKGADDGFTSAVVYNALTPGTMSKQNPTFNIAP
jgi:prepilin-type N-terminal cleavage/methylation domain-containing protein/prepilin-type processing-associated H-X9-DG protein